MRNCPWTMGLWKSYLLALERHGAEHHTVSGETQVEDGRDRLTPRAPRKDCGHRFGGLFNFFLFLQMFLKRP